MLRLLLHSRRKGLSCSSTIMIGRQNYSELTPSDLSSALGITTEEASALLGEKYIEPLLQRFGANRIESIDNSAFENATTIHDLNQPIPEHLKATFTCVLDGGAIEHVFNFPQAMKNCMEMVQIGGHFLGVTTANNFMGHGFYQFSPELYYRVFSPQNGFEVEEMLLCETDRGAPWYRVTDPEKLGHRVELVNNRPAYIMVMARRVSNAPIFKTTPQQSDYVSLWDQTPHRSAPVKRSARSIIAGFLPHAIKAPLKKILRHNKPFPNKSFQSDAYRKV